MNGWDTDYRDPDELAAARRWRAAAYGPRPGLAETPRGLRRFLPGLLAGGAAWAGLLWLIGRVGG